MKVAVIKPVVITATIIFGLSLLFTFTSLGKLHRTDASELKDTFYKPNVVQTNKNGDNVAGDKNSAKNQLIVKGGQVNSPHVGDDITISEHYLTNKAKIKFLKDLKKLEKDSDITSKQIVIAVAEGSNGGKIPSQLQELLEAKGYSANILGFSPEPHVHYKEISTKYENGYIRVDVGTFK